MLGGTLARRLALLGGGFATLASTTAAGLWWQLFRRPLPAHQGSLRLDGARGTGRDSA